MKTGKQADLWRELEKEHGIKCSKNAISKLVKSGDPRIIKTPQGKIKIPETCKLLVETDFGKRRACQINRVTEPTEPAQKTIKPEQLDTELEKKFYDDQDTNGEVPPLLESNKMLAFQNARKAKYNADLLNKMSVLVEDVETKSFDLFREIRDKTKSAFEKVSIKIRSAKTNHEARQISNREYHKIFDSIIADFDSDDDTVKKNISILLIE